MKTIRFSLTDDEYRIIHHEATARGLTTSAYSKAAVFSHVNKYPTKGVFAELAKIRGTPSDAAESLLSNAVRQWWEDAFLRKRTTGPYVSKPSGEKK